MIFYVHIPKNQTGMASISMVTENIELVKANAQIVELQDEVRKLTVENFATNLTQENQIEEYSRCYWIEHNKHRTRCQNDARATPNDS